MPSIPDTKAPPRWPLIGLGVVLAAVAAVAFTQAAKLDYDFHHFYRDAAYVWQHGHVNPNLDHPDRTQRRQLTFYLPVVSLLLAPLTAGGPKPAALAWTLAQLVALAYSLKLLSGWSPAQGSRAPPRAAIALATLLALPALYENARFNQLSFFVLALVLAGVAGLERDKPVRAGVCLGVATVLKLLPGIFLLWLALKRQWTALTAGLVTIAILALLPCLVVFGPRDTATYHRQWWNHNFRGSAGRGMIDSDLRSHFIDHRNQALPAVVARLCWPEHPRGVSFQPLKLDRDTCQQLSRGLMILLALLLLFLTRRPLVWPRRQGLSDVQMRDRLRIEAAVYLLAMLVFSPLLRTYYLPWALPGLVLLTRSALDNRTRFWQRLGQVGCALWLLGMLAWMSDTARTCGVHLIMSIALAGLLLGIGRRLAGSQPPIARQPT